MKMKHALGLFLVLTILFPVQVVSAQGPELPDPGTTPDSWAYGFKRFFEGADMFFTFDDLAKAEKHANYAGLRLSEAKAMAERGRPEFVDGLAKEYEDNIKAANEIAKNAQQIGKDTTKVTELVGLATSIHLGVLDDVYERVPEQAKEAILRAKRASVNGQKNALAILSEDNPGRAANINLDTVKGRLNRAREMAEAGKSKGVEQSLEEYGELVGFSGELAEKDEAVLEQVASNFNDQIEDLDDVEDKAPADVRAKVEEKKSASLEKQKETLRELAKTKPEKATEINLKAAENRLNEAKEEAEENEVEEVEEEIKEFEKLVEFGDEISQIAQGIGKDTTTVEQLVAQATSIHLTILAEVYEKVPEQAKPAIENAMNVSVENREGMIEALKQKNALGDTPEEVPLPEEVKGRIPKSVPIERPETETPETERPETGQEGRP